MSDRAGETEPIEPPRPPSEPRSRWRGAVRWFAAEFLVVVSGVLVALALQAWYQARQDARTEGDYLRQLLVDLDANARMLADAIREDSLRLDANSRLLAAVYRVGPPAPDSARSWLRWQLGFYSDPRPVLGTVSMLIATGDVRLIRDSRLRSEIVAYASSMAMDMEDLGRSVTRLTQATDAERRQLERDGVPPLFPAFGATRAVLPGSYGDEQVDGILPRYLAIWPVVQTDPELRSAYAVRVVSFALRVFYLTRMLGSTNELRRSVHEAWASPSRTE